MTHDEIDTMAAGLEMDVAVARAMGCDVRPTPQGWSPRGFYCACDHPNFEQPPHGVEPDWDCDPYLKPYSTDIAAAWEVVEKMNADYDVMVRQQRFKPDVWECYIVRNGPLGPYDRDFWEGRAATAPLAICHAALKVVTNA